MSSGWGLFTSGGSSSSSSKASDGSSVSGPALASLNAWGALQKELKDAEAAGSGCVGEGPSAAAKVGPTGVSGPGSDAETRKGADAVAALILNMAGGDLRAAQKEGLVTVGATLQCASWCRSDGWTSTATAAAAPRDEAVFGVEFTPDDEPGETAPSSSSPSPPLEKGGLVRSLRLPSNGVGGPLGACPLSLFGASLVLVDLSGNPNCVVELGSCFGLPAGGGSPATPRLEVLSLDGCAKCKVE